MIALDTIAAIATAPGAGAIGVVRVSGPAVPAIAAVLLGRLPRPRQAVLRTFRDDAGEAIDQGLALYFPAPRSFTGEHLLELQGHGGPVVMDLLLARVLALGARPARPGEFSERAFLNGKLDLVQAEAIADLIASTTVTGARLASRSLQGVFSRRIEALQEGLTRLRTLVEAHLDFPEEDLEAPADRLLPAAVDGLLAELTALRDSAHQGELLQEGFHVVIAGPPNAGKSSLLNALSGRDAAIVTAIPGTTRDPLRVDLQIDGLPLRVIDTAGLRDSGDPVEQEGIRRARAAAAQADHLLWVVDATAGETAAEPDVRAAVAALLPGLPPDIHLTRVRNKIDLLPEHRRADLTRRGEVACSALTGAGLDRLRSRLKHQARYRGPEAGEFSARRRHLEALDRAGVHLGAALAGAAAGAPGELLAEDLRQAQHALAEVTGEVSADDLLGRIFSEFCIGK